MPISQSDFQRACLTYKLNWPSAGNDGKTVAQRLDQLQAAVLAAIDVIEQPVITEARVQQLVDDAIRQQPPAMTEARANEMIEAAILDQHPELAAKPPEKPGGGGSGGGDSLLPDEPWSDGTFWSDGFGWSGDASALLLAELGAPVLLSESGYQLLLAEA